MSSSTHAVLTKGVKDLLLEQIREHFTSFSAYREKLKVVNRRSDLPRFAYGIFLRNVSANKIQFSPENYLGLVSSFVSMAKVGHRPGAFLRFVRENDNNLIYGVRNEDLSAQVDGVTTQFVVGNKPVLKQTKKFAEVYPADMPENIQVKVNGKVVEVASVEGRTGSFRLAKPPPVGATVLVSYIFRYLTDAGYYFIQVEEPLVENLPQGRKKVTPRILVGEYGAAEREAVSIRHTDLKLRFTPGYLRNNSIELRVDGAALPPETYSIYPEGDFIQFHRRPLGTNFQVFNTDMAIAVDSYTVWKFESYKEVVLVADASGSEQYLSLTDPEPVDVDLYLNSKKQVPRGLAVEYDYELTNNKTMIKMREKLPKNSELVAKYTYVDQRVEDVVPVSAVFDPATKYSIFHSAEPLVPDFFEVYQGNTLLDPNSYYVDYPSGMFTFLDIPLIGKEYKVSYRYSKGTSGPYEVTPNSVRDDILQGVLLYFGYDFNVGDKAVVLVGNQRKDCMDEYGGKWQMSVEFAVTTPDFMATEEIADELLMFFQTRLKPLFDAQGMFVEDVSHGGESDEIEDEATGETHPVASINLV